MNNVRDFVEIITAALVCATGGVVVVQGLLALERRRTAPSIDAPQKTVRPVAVMVPHESDISDTNGSRLSEGMRNALGIELSLSLSEIENGIDEANENHAATLLDFVVHRKRRPAASDLGAREAQAMSAANMYSKGA